MWLTSDADRRSVPTDRPGPTHYDRAVRTDLGVTHVALPVTNLDASLAFYERFASMRVVHKRTDPSTETSVAWISDLTRPFVLVLIETATVESGLGGLFCHVGVGVRERSDVDRLCAMAKADGRTVLGPLDAGPPVGYWAYIVDPDGHNLEISYGQEVGLTVEQASS
jgi:catechol 2,3-dioxygenase-like lactoylglutathione lyase family enzyme